MLRTFLFRLTRAIKCVHSSSEDVLFDFFVILDMMTRLSNKISFIISQKRKKMLNIDS